MKTTVYIEIPVEIIIDHTFSEPVTNSDPGYPEKFELVTYLSENIMNEVDKAIDKLDQKEIDDAGKKALESYAINQRETIDFIKNI